MDRRDSLSRRAPASFWVGWEGPGPSVLDLRDVYEKNGFTWTEGHAGSVNTRRAKDGELHAFDDRSLYAGRRFQRVVQVGQLALQGLSHNEICKRTGVCRATIRKIDRFIAHWRHTYRTAHFTDRAKHSQIAQAGRRHVRALLEAGHSIRAIRSKYGYGNTTIRAVQRQVIAEGGPVNANQRTTAQACGQRQAAMRKARTLLLNNGNLSVRDVARIAGIRYGTVREIRHALIESGQISDQRKPKNGRRGASPPGAP